MPLREDIRWPDPRSISEGKEDVLDPPCPLPSSRSRNLHGGKATRKPAAPCPPGLLRVEPAVLFSPQVHDPDREQDHEAPLLPDGSLPAEEVVQDRDPPEDREEGGELALVQAL